MEVRIGSLSVGSPAGRGRELADRMCKKLGGRGRKPWRRVQVGLLWTRRNIVGISRREKVAKSLLEVSKEGV